MAGDQAGIMAFIAVGQARREGHRVEPDSGLVEAGRDDR